jgi:starch synthase (maltosyl-transferring)
LAADHPEWFNWRPDGSIKYAENPPKKYEDIVNVDFYGSDAKGLWAALRTIVLYWAGVGVRIFRVDNPHTKALPFWEWMITEVRTLYPDVIFLSEAFTWPKMMYRLAKLGFSQSATTHLAQHETGADRLSHRAHHDEVKNSSDRIFRQHAGHQPILPSDLRAARLPDPRGACRDPVRLWGVYSGFELHESAPCRARGISRLENTRFACAIRTRRAT